MLDLESFTDEQRRHLVHIYAALREGITVELEYDRTPEFPPLDDGTYGGMYMAVFDALTALMAQTHADEAATIEAVWLETLGLTPKAPQPGGGYE